MSQSMSLGSERLVGLLGLPLLIHTEVAPAQDFHETRRSTGLWPRWTQAAPGLQQ